MAMDPFGFGLRGKVGTFWATGAEAGATGLFVGSASGLSRLDMNGLIIFPKFKLFLRFLRSEALSDEAGESSEGCPSSLPDSSDDWCTRLLLFRGDCAGLGAGLFDADERGEEGSSDAIDVSGLDSVALAEMKPTFGLKFTPIFEACLTSKPS